MLSRCFGGESEVGLAPYIDMLNHRQGAQRPSAFEQDGQVYVYVNTPKDPQLGLQQGLREGEELCICYNHVAAGPNSVAPWRSLMNFGFVPDELRA